MVLKDIGEDCSWQEVYRLNSIVIDGDEDLDFLELDEIDTLVVEFKSPLKPFLKFGVPELIVGRE